MPPEKLGYHGGTGRKQTIQSLSPSQRRIIMAMLAGDSTNKMCAEMQLSSGAIWQQMTRARNRTGLSNYQLCGAVAAELVRTERLFAAFDSRDIS